MRLDAMGAMGAMGAECMSRRRRTCNSVRLGQNASTGHRTFRHIRTEVRSSKFANPDVGIQ